MNLDLSASAQWPYAPTLSRLGLALALGIFVGMVRERRGKEAGIRTFGFVALIGCLGALAGEAYALAALGLVGILVVFLNWQRLKTNETAELTTSAALITVAFVGLLCGRGHTFTPVAVAVGAAGLLAWKERLSHFSVGLTEGELRSAILLAILAFVIYPALPTQAVDPWGLVEPRTAWATVILIAAVGFVNYVLYKLYGARGMLLSAFLSGLVNSTVAVVELANRTRESGAEMVGTAYRGIMAANGAMLLRNAVLAGILAPMILPQLAAPLVAMLAVNSFIAWWSLRDKPETEVGPEFSIKSPFSLASALKFGLLFVVLDAGGALAQRYLGQAGFYAVALVGGLVSSASAVASAATLAKAGHLPVSVAANGAVLAVIASAVVNAPLVGRVAQNGSLTRKVAVAIGIVSAVGIGTIALQALFL